MKLIGKINLGQRLGSMLIDHIIMTLIAAGLGIPLMILNFFVLRYFEMDLKWIFGIFIFVLYFNKDFFNGKSIAKRLTGLIVMKNNDNEVASSLQCFVRNLTIIIWPIEVLISLFSRHRRLGDFIAGTRIELSNKEGIATLITEFKDLVNQN
jgi:uncharacterized RDD family membrane protein YckC